MISSRNSYFIFVVYFMWIILIYGFELNVFILIKSGVVGGIGNYLFFRKFIIWFKIKYV